MAGIADGHTVYPPIESGHVKKVPLAGPAPTGRGGLFFDTQQQVHQDAFAEVRLDGIPPTAGPGNVRNPKEDS